MLRLQFPIQDGLADRCDVCISELASLETILIDFKQKAEKIHLNEKIVHTSTAVATSLSATATIVSAVATFFTAGLALPFLIGSIAGGVCSITTKLTSDAITSKQAK